MKTLKELQENLQKLRNQLETTRPLCPTETRPFTYQKRTKDERGVQTWKWVTIDSTVTLRRLGDPKSEQCCQEISQQIRETKTQIKNLGYKPIDHGKKIRDDYCPDKLEPREAFI
jgi:hypothetical protein